DGEVVRILPPLRVPLAAPRFRALGAITAPRLVPRLLLRPLPLLAAGNGMHVLAAEPRVGILPAALERFARRIRGNQRIAPAANEVLPARLLERPPHFEVVLGLKELHQR